MQTTLKLLFLVVSALGIIGCLFHSGDEYRSNNLVGQWKQPYRLFVRKSVYFDNKDSINTRSQFLPLHELDSNSCKPDFLDSDTNALPTGTWEFKSNGKYVNTYIFNSAVPNPRGGDEIIPDSATETGEYEIQKDTLRLIFSRILDKMAFEIRTFKINDTMDTLLIIQEEAAYIHGNCSIRIESIDQLIRTE